MSVSDTSRPSYGVPDGQRRMLLLQLSDGQRSVKAVEWQPLGQALSEAWAPGTKVTTSTHLVQSVSAPLSLKMGVAGEGQCC
jgi:hypothetical protein